MPQSFLRPPYPVDTDYTVHIKRTVMLSSDLLYDVQTSEGCRLTAYKDTLGNWTVGYGHLLAPGKDWSGYTITSDYARSLLTLDITTAKAIAADLPEYRALDTPARQDAVTELVFNMGPSRWRQFVHCRAALSDQKWEEASAQLLQSLWAKQVKKERADRLATQILTGNYSSV